jgi:hypothetical protein
MGASGPNRDPVSSGRYAIAPDPQDDIDEPINVLINATRDSVEALLDRGNDLGVAYLNLWAATQVPILRRLAVHGWAHRSDIDDTAKIVWLREQGWLFDHQLRHEVYGLIEAALPGAGDVADALVADIVAGFHSAPVDDRRAYEQFNTLAWITRCAPDLQSAQIAFERAQADHPCFNGGTPPDRLLWSEAGTIQPQPPMTATELHDRIVADVEDAITDLRRYEGVTWPFEGPTWQDALTVLTEAVRRYPPDGFSVLDADGGDHRAIVRAVVRGWAAATVDGEAAEAILDRLARVDLAALSDDLAGLISDNDRGDPEATKWHRFAGARRLAVDLWATLNGELSDSGVKNWLARATSSTAGQLGLFWAHAVAADWRAAGDAWEGLPPETRAQLDVLLAGHSNATAMVEVVFASQLLFFFGADRDWCETHVLPLLDRANRPRARRTWDGFLTWGRWNDQLLTAGLMEHYMGAARDSDDLSEQARRKLYAHLALVALYSELDTLRWSQTFTRSTQVADRVEWMHEVAWRLKKLPTDAVESQWRRWMRQYWQDRLDSIPLQLTLEESSAMAAWVVHLTDSIEDGVALATAQPAALGQHADLLRDLDDERINRRRRPSPGFSRTSCGALSRPSGAATT